MASGSTPFFAPRRRGSPRKGRLAAPRVVPSPLPPGWRSHWRCESYTSLAISRRLSPTEVRPDHPRALLGPSRRRRRCQRFHHHGERCFDLPASSREGNSVEGLHVRYFPRAVPKRFFGAAGMKDVLRQSSRPSIWSTYTASGTFPGGLPSGNPGGKPFPTSFPLEACWTQAPSRTIACGRRLLIAFANDGISAGRLSFMRRPLRRRVSCGDFTSVPRLSSYPMAFRCRRFAREVTSVLGAVCRPTPA